MTPQRTTTTSPPIRLLKPQAKALLIVAALLAGPACTQKQLPIEIDFTATWNGTPISCQSESMRLSDLRFYVSDLTIIDTEGVRNPLTVFDAAPWQQDGVAMLDLEDGEGGCENGTALMQSSIKGESAAASAAGLEMTIGVPFELNHANPLTARAPLDDSAMHWHWRSGYKFLRAGVENNSDGFWLHLGSTGCEGTVQNISGCKSPNRVRVVIENLPTGKTTVEIDLSTLFAGIDLGDGERGDCSSGPAEATCAGPFTALGLPRQNSEGAEQQVFKAARQPSE